MKQKYIIPTVEISAVAARAMFMENVSFTIDSNDPRGGWSDAKGRLSDEELEEILGQQKDGWNGGLW